MIKRMPLLGACVVITFILMTSAFAALPRPNFDVQNQADYIKLKQAISASQVVMTDLSRSPNNRIVGVIASILQAAAKNPEITIEQIDAFANDFDARIQNSNPNDQNLLVPIDFLTTMRFGMRKAKQPGMRADFGLETLQMLGIHDKKQADPRLFSPEEMMSFLNEQGLDLANSSEVNLVLTYGFLGLDANGQKKPIVQMAFVHYLSSQNVDPFPTPAIVAEKYPDLLSAIAALPDNYTAFQALRSNGLETVCASAIAKVTPLVSDVMPELIDRAVQVDAAQKSNYIASLANPNAQFVADARARRIQDIEVLNQTRLNVQAQLAMVSIAGNDTEANTANAAGKYAGTALKVCDGLSKCVTAFAAPNASSILGAVSGVMGIFGISSGIFGADETGSLLTQMGEVKTQVTQLRTQVLEMQQQLNSRFDAVDASLNEILYDLGDVQKELNQVHNNVLELQSNQNHISQNLYRSMQDVYEQAFRTTINGAINYKYKHDLDLPWDGSDLTFVESENDIYTQATATRDLAIYTDSPVDLTLVNAADLLTQKENPASSGDYVDIGLYLNDLRLLPRNPQFGLEALYSNSIANPTAWATAAYAYSQLARENPWFWIKTKTDDLNTITHIGQNAQDALQSFGNKQFLTTLVNHHRGLLDELATITRNEILSKTLRNLTQLTPRGDVDKAALDIFGSTSQVVWPGTLSINVYKEWDHLSI